MNKLICLFRYLLIGCVFSLIITVPALSQLPGSASSKDTGSQGADIPTARGVHAVGGISDLGTLSKVLEYDPETDTWRTKFRMFPSLWSHATYKLNGKTYLIGHARGWPPNLNYSKIEEYKPMKDTWTAKSPIPASRIGFNMYSVNGKIYAPGGGGGLESVEYAEVYTYDIGNATSIDNNSIKPVNFNLHQNYPNPFDLTTHISFDVQKDCYVTLHVYDVMGRQVSTLVNRNMNEGQYKVQFNGAGLSSGIYLYKIEMGNYSKTRIMMLNK